MVFVIRPIGGNLPDGYRALPGILLFIEDRINRTFSPRLSFSIVSHHRL